MAALIFIVPTNQKADEPRHICADSSAFYRLCLLGMPPEYRVTSVYLVEPRLRISKPSITVFSSISSLFIILVSKRIATAPMSYKG